MTTTETTESSLSPTDVDYFGSLVDRRIGVQLAGKEYLIESRLQPLARDNGLTTVSDVITAMRRGDRAIEDAAIEAMTTNETSFFRDQHPFDTLVSDVIPQVIADTGGRLTIWNGACSSGQESYTLAMSIVDNFPDLMLPGRTTIVSTDVSPQMVERTREGKYSRFEVNRGLPASQAVKHFDQAGRNWVAKPELRAMIDARELNLLERWSGLPKCDIVLMRNVLIYFTVPVKQDILRRIRTEVLKPGGCLLLGASETTVGIDDGFEGRRVGGSTFYYPKGV